MYGRRHLLRASSVLGIGGSAAALLSVKPVGHDAEINWRPRASPSDVEAATRRWSQALKCQGPTGDQYLIVGMGSLGTRIARALLERGEQRVRCLDMQRSQVYETLERTMEGNIVRPEFVCADVTETAQVEAACRGGKAALAA